MLLNATTGPTAISTPKVLLVPYSKWHVPRYHEWMKDEEIQQATASEPLTLDEEYVMQQSWRNDADKLTFIICLPVPSPTGGNSSSDADGLTDDDDSPARMIGDINLFLRIEDEEEEEESASATPQIIGEIELMVAEKKDQGQGFGKAALLAFLRYVLGWEGEVVREFVRGDEEAGRVMGVMEEGLKFAALSVKIGQGNERSLKLFEGLGFGRVGDAPNYFGEWELRRMDWDLHSDSDLGSDGLGGYREIWYGRTE
ncbi:GNAT domain-containing protein [Aspergillus aurantiobrunneus]